MPLTMIQPTKHSKSGVYRIRLTVPAELRDSARSLYGKSREFTVNLHTKDKCTAMKRGPAALAKLQAKLDLVRALHAEGLKTLTHREVRAIAGEWYKDAVGRNEDDPGDFAVWDEHKSQLLDDRTFPEGDPDSGKHPDYEPDKKALEEARGLLADRQIVATEATVEALAVALWEAKLNFADLMMRRAAGDYGADKYAATVPALPVSDAPAPDFGPATTFNDAVRGWAFDSGHNPDARPIPRAVYDRQRTAARLADFLGHHSVPRVAKADAVKWKESLQAAGLSPATIANDLSEMSAVWRWAVNHAKAEANPFAGILPPKKARSRKATRRAFTQDEAIAILAAARNERGALRWLPWVLAATGARLSEVCQAVKEDLIEREGFTFLRIHEDDDERAGVEGKRSVKNEMSERMVPMHAALVAEGFLNYVASLPARSPLFPDVKPDKIFGSRGTSAQRLIARWLRGKLKIMDEKISPAHSWRHWFIERARQAGLHPEIRNAITGHADDANESHRYGQSFRQMPQVLAEAMARISFPKVPD